MQSRFDYLDLHCFADPMDARRYYFLPAVPDLQRNPEGQPMITLVDTGASGYLMFTATWGASAERIEGLRDEIARGHLEHDPRRIVLAPAPIAGPRCHVLLGDGSGTFQTIASSDTSGVPPYDALFNLALPGDRLRQARRAMGGARQWLAIEYVADLLVPSSASATFHADAGALLPWLRARAGGGTPFRRLLDDAIECGLATVTVDAPDHANGRVSIELFERVVTRAAELIPQWINEGGRGEIEVAAGFERDARQPVRACADIGGIVAGGPTRPS